MATTRRLRSSAASPRSILYDNTKRAVARISMKLHRDLEITQKTAWHLALHRLRKAVSGKAMGMFQGPVSMAAENCTLLTIENQTLQTCGRTPRRGVGGV